MVLVEGMKLAYSKALLYPLGSSSTAQPHDPIQPGRSKSPPCCYPETLGESGEQVPYHCLACLLACIAQPMGKGQLP